MMVPNHPQVVLDTALLWQFLLLLAGVIVMQSHQRAACLRAAL